MTHPQWQYTQADAAALSEYTLAWDMEKEVDNKRKVVKKYMACDSVEDEWKFIEGQADKYAYEVIREGAPVNPYFDIEWLEPTTVPSAAADAADRIVMRTFIERVRMIAVMRHGLSEPPQISVTTSTRFTRVSVREAKRYGMYAAAVAGGGLGGISLTNDDWASVDGSLMMDGQFLKRSYHVVVRGLVFVNNTDASFMDFINAVFSRALSEISLHFSS